MVRTIYQQLSPAEVHGQSWHLVVGTTGSLIVTRWPHCNGGCQPDIQQGQYQAFRNAPNGRSCGPTTRRNIAKLNSRSCEISSRSAPEESGYVLEFAQQR